MARGLAGGAAAAHDGRPGWTSEFTGLDFLDQYDARFVIVTQGSIEDALAYKERVGNRMEWYSTAHSPFGADMGAPPDAGFDVLPYGRQEEWQDVPDGWPQHGTYDVGRSPKQIGALYGAASG